MRGSIVKYSVVAVVSVIIGWTACVLFEHWSILTLDLSISVTDVLTLVVEVGLALFVANVLERGLQNKRVEKDFYLKELDDILIIFSELERLCAQQSVLSLDVTVESLSRSKRILNRLWKLKEEYETSFARQNQKVYNTVLASIKDVDKKLTDAKALNGEPKVTPIKISNGKIYLNSSVRPIIEESISQAKKDLFKMKVLINNE